MYRVTQKESHLLYLNLKLSDQYEIFLSYTVGHLNSPLAHTISSPVHLISSLVHFISSLTHLISSFTHSIRHACISFRQPCISFRHAQIWFNVEQKPIELVQLIFAHLVLVSHNWGVRCSRITKNELITLSVISYYQSIYTKISA